MYKFMNLLKLFCCLIVILMFPISTFSLTVADVSTEDLTQKSDLIVKGKVVHKECRWEDSNQKAINTYSTIQVENYLKGEGTDYIIVKQLGGRIGDISDEIDGTPSLEIGEEMVLFLCDFNGDNVIFSMALGCYKIIEDENNKKFAVNDLRNVNLMVSKENQKEASANKFKSFNLDDFLFEVNSIAN